ncbi:MAG: hypothetical protein JWN73_2231 [Betaproteobacteria bacterium]|nr:hypothetical protein [Betaproteobacteria bacterium]
MALHNREPALWAKLVALPLDRLAGEPAPEFDFVKRLMREEGWDYATAIRVSAEYRRFLLLAALGPVSPSPRIDAAWHLHLTYTRAYNIGLCERTLGHTLDHAPSGSAGETAHYESVYEDTLNRYLALFEEEPPADIWPPVKPHIRAAKPGGKPWSSARIACSLALVLMLGFLAKPGFAIFLTIVFLLLAASVAHAMSDEGKKRRADGSSCGGGCGSGGDGGSCGSSCGSGCGGGCGGGCG